MLIPLQVTFRGFQYDKELEANLRARVAGLEPFQAHLRSCRVVIEENRARHQPVPRFSVRIELGLAGGQLVVNRADEEDLHAALQESFDAARYRIEEHVGRLRREEKAHGLGQSG